MLMLGPAIPCINILQEARRHLNTTQPINFPFSSQDGWLDDGVILLMNLPQNGPRRWRCRTLDAICSGWGRNDKQENSVHGVVKLLISRGSLWDYKRLPPNGQLINVVRSSIRSCLLSLKIVLIMNDIKLKQVTSEYYLGMILSSNMS